MPSGAKLSPAVMTQVRRIDIAGRLQLLRPHLRRLMPRSLHHLAGHAGRWVVRAIEHRAAMPAVGPPVTLPAVSDRHSGADPVQIVVVNASLAAGGAERQVVNLLRGLAVRGWRARLVTLYLGERPELRHFLADLEASGLAACNALPVGVARSVLIAAFGRPAVDALLASISWAPLDIRDDIVRLAAELHHIRPAVVHGWQDATGIVAAFAALAVGTPRIVVGGRNLHPEHFSHARPYMRRAMQFLASRPEVVLTNNSVAGAQSYAAWLELDASQIRVVRNGVETQQLQPPNPQRAAEFRHSIGVPPDATLVGGAFRLQAEKRPLLWLDAAKLISRQRPDVHFVIYGDGTMRRRVQKAAGLHGLDGRLALPGSVGDMRVALGCLDAMLLTSAQEGTPNSVLEAVCLGVPVVATGAGGTVEAMLDGVTGVVVREEAVSEGSLASELAMAVSTVLARKPAREAMRREGRAFVEAKFGLERMVEEMMGLYAL